MFQSQPQFCPCALSLEEIKEYSNIDGDLKCTAGWADGSGTICGRPLGAHPRERDINPALASGKKSL
jgi:hypothetical protein